MPRLSMALGLASVVLVSACSSAGSSTASTKAPASAAMARVEVGVGVGATFAVRSVGPRHLVPDPFQAEQSPERRERSRRPQCRRPPPRPVHASRRCAVAVGATPG